MLKLFSPNKKKNKLNKNSASTSEIYKLKKKIHQNSTNRAKLKIFCILREKINQNNVIKIQTLKFYNITKVQVTPKVTVKVTV